MDYIFYKNTQTTPTNGYMSGLLYGYLEGDQLTLAYEGEIPTTPGETDQAIADRLFEIFNIDRPENYAGFDMSVGDVICLYKPHSCAHRAYAVASCGFVEVDLHHSPMLARPEKWVRVCL
jgi:hypothetical protein